MDWTHSFAQQGPFVMFLVLCGWAGYRDMWGFTTSFNKQLAEKDKVITEKDKAFLELREYATLRMQEQAAGYEGRIRVLVDGYEARLKDKEIECQRIIDSSAKKEQYIDRLIAVGMTATALAAKVTQSSADGTQAAAGIS